MSVRRIVRLGLFSIVCAGANAASAASIAYYGLNETGTLKGQTATDASGAGQNGTYAAAGTGPTSIASVNPMYGTAVHFDSAVSKDYVNIPAFSGLTQAGALTYALWVNPDATQLSSPTLIGNASSNTRGFDFRVVASSGAFKLQLVDPAANVLSTTTIPAGVWSHVAVTKDIDGSGGAGLANYQFYINGNPIESGTIATGGSDPTALELAASRSSGSYFGGGLDEVHIYNEVLSGSAIAGLAVVPEPNAILLMGLGALGLAGYGWRKRK